MIIIAVTGSMGSGKTTVSKFMKKQTGFVIANADRIAKKILGTEAKIDVLKIFGTVNRKKLADTVFSDEKKLNKLNNIMHPLVKKRIENMSKRHKNLIIDVPLIIESGKMKVDVLILVKCTRRKQLSRMVKAGFVRDDVLRRLKHQMPFSRKLQRAKKISRKIFVIDNSYSLDNTKKQIEEIIQEMIR